MTRMTGRKWRTERCGRCGEPHIGYSGKLDKNGDEYVVCEKTNKKMLVRGSGCREMIFYTKWEQEYLRRAWMKAICRDVINFKDESGGTFQEPQKPYTECGRCGEKVYLDCLVEPNLCPSCGWTGFMEIKDSGSLSVSLIPAEKTISQHQFMTSSVKVGDDDD